MVSTQTLEKNVVITRYSMYRSIDATLSQLSGELNGKVLTISGTPHEIIKSFDTNNTELTETDYPEVDISSLPYNSDTFDWVISDQAIEHVPYPWKAVEETRRALKRGGIAIHTTCAFNPLHEHPRDYWRFMPDGLRVLCKNFSEIITCDSWGNREVMQMAMDGHRPVVTNQNRELAERNEKEWPFVTWIIARK